ncbi:hypothetical protein NEDG_02050 [Nematocida displodere]|uniref:Uncharacterized protein n=1 Tax=Nematocida displodere TaxID=1805483 RepID=A0A177EMT2_9MICR|nr:hypothetical protein NEDG_02050 [Nematocida displodere]
MRKLKESISRLERIAASTEEALSTDLNIDALEEARKFFETELAASKEALLTAGAEGALAYSALTKRLSICTNRLNVIRISGASEDAYTKMREAPDDYYARNSVNLSNYIKIASNSVTSLEKQRAFLSQSRKKLEEGLGYLGLSDRVVDQISNRYLSDYRLFKGLSALFILLFIYVFFLRK